MSKLTNKDKMNIRQALFSQIENIVVLASDKSGYYKELENLSSEDIRNYAEKLIGLHSK